MDEKEVLSTLVKEWISDKRSQRRWRIFRWFLLISVVVLIFFASNTTENNFAESAPHIALINLEGEIKNEQSASSQNLIESFQKAFENKAVRGIILKINSPGGSPVQAGAVFDEMMRLKKNNPQKPIYAVIEDVGASGAYYIAAAADEIYVHPSSLVGSIGVIMNQFGLDKVIEKLGIEQRTITAGKNKAFLDPFSPLDLAQKTHAQQLVNRVHGHFIQAVKTGRGKRLKENDEIFSGLVWTGEDAIALGLADKIGQVNVVQREVLDNLPLRDYSVKSDLSERVLKQLGVQMRLLLREQMFF